MSGRGGEETDVSVNKPGPRDPGPISRRWPPRPVLLAAAVVLGAAVPLCRGLSTGTLMKVLGAPLRAAVDAARAPGSASSKTPAVPPPAGSSPAGTSDHAPTAAGAAASDVRVSAALRWPVRLKAATGSLRTDLRALGVRLIWPENGEPQWSLDEPAFNHGLRRLARRVEHLPRNARLIHTESGFHSVPASPGHMLDRDSARRELMATLTRPAFRQALESCSAGKPAPIILAIPLREVAPAVSANHLGAINTLLASFSTSLGGSSRNRRHNIRVACEAIDGTVLQPGQSFSYNAAVGPRTERAGFRTAPVIIHGELVPGTGGGVCQVSSTLYNIALLGDLKIVRRTHHHFPVHYVLAGRDATVAYGSLDLRFANTLPGPVALDVKCTGSRVVARLYGAAGCKRDVQVVSRRATGPHRRAAGAAALGKRVVVTRVVRLTDGSVRREVMSRDSYAPPPPKALSSSRRQRGQRRTHLRERGRPRPPAPGNMSTATQAHGRAPT